MHLVSWNVNGIRAAIRKGFWQWLEAATPDIVCLQETRVHPDQLPEEMPALSDYSAFWHSGERKGYSGVATFSRGQPLAAQEGFGRPNFDAEGRVLITEHPGFTLLNVYFPSGRRGHERVAYKLEFYDALLEHCTELWREDRPLIVCGDYNTAHEAIDLARPRENVKTSGFLPEEREAFQRWLDRGFVDVYRRLHPDAREYTWWTYLFEARSRNIGWRIDYFLVTEDLLPRVEDARILTEVTGSDHCPVELWLKS
jgi:exodeoxyribonuclease-3